MTCTASIAFLGQYRPAYFEGPTVAAAVAKARIAVSDNMPDADKVRRWLDDSAAWMRDRNCSSSSTEHGCLAVTVRRGAHDAWLDRVTADMPHCPGLDYSKASNVNGN